MLSGYGAMNHTKKNGAGHLKDKYEHFAKEWQDAIPFVPKGAGLVFQPQLNSTSISISNIRVIQRGGAGFAAGSQEKLAPDQVDVSFGNRDEMRGRAPMISDGILKITGLEMPLDFPVTRVAQIVFPSIQGYSSRSEARQIQAEISGSGVISFALERWGEKAVSGRSEIFGAVSFDPRSIRKIKFDTGNDSGAGVWARTVPDEFTELDLATREPESRGPGGVKAIVPMDTLQLTNGDRLRGTLNVIDPKQQVRWTSPQVVGAIDFVPESVRAVQLGQRPTPSLPAEGQWRIWLTNGEFFEGQILRLTAEQLVLETWYAGVVEIPRSRIQRISSKLPFAKAKFEGPTSLEGWTIGSVSSVTNGGQWSYRDGAFYASRAASIARNVELPDSARMEWDLRWSDTLYIAVALYADQLQPIDLLNKEAAAPFGGFYSLQIYNVAGMVRLLAVTKTNTTPDLGQASVPSLVQTNAGHFEVLVSKPRQTIAILIDGKLVKEWKETNGFIGAGTGIRFVHQGQGTVKLSGFRVSDWDGQYEEMLLGTPESKEDRLKLLSGEEFTGQWRGLANGIVSFRAANGNPIDTPIERVKYLDFAGEKLDWNKAETINARGYLWNGSTIGLQLEDWRDDRVKASSSSFGSATFLRAAFRRIEFF